MNMEQRVSALENKVSRLMKLQSKPTHYQVRLFASNDHIELEMKLKTWLRSERPKRIIDTRFVADGAEYTYCIMVLYQPQKLPLPDIRR